MKQLIAILTDDKAELQERAAAAVSLGESGHKGAVKPLVKTLTCGYPALAAEAAEALGNLGFASAIKPLAKALNGREPMGVMAAVALGKIGGKKSIKALCGCVVDQTAKKSARIQAATTLGELRHVAAIKPLIATLGASEKKLQIAAINALGAIGDPAAVPALMRVFKRGFSQRVEAAACEVLGNLRDVRAVETLCGVLLEGVANHRKLGPYKTHLAAAAEALGKLGDPKAVRPLIGTLETFAASITVAGTAALALGSLGDRRAVRPLREALDSPSIKGHCAVALVKLGEPAEDMIKEGLEDPDWGVRRVVAHAIADIRKYGERAAAGLSSLPRGELGYDLVDLVTNGVVIINGTCSTTTDMHLGVNTAVKDPIPIHIPAGTVFTAGGHWQDMVVTRSETFELRIFEKVVLHVTGVNASLEYPSDDENLRQISRADEVVVRILEKTAHNKDPRAIQAAVWAVTNNCSAADVQERVRSTTTDDPLLTAKYLGEARSALDELGISHRL